MSPYLKVNLRDKKYGVIIGLSGRLERATHKKFSFILKELVLDKIPCMALDLSNLDYLDAKGLSLITELINLLNKKKIPLFAYGMNSDVYNILDFVDAAMGIKMLENEKEFKEKALETSRDAN